ncbi:MAG: hypothetical protein ACO1QB_12205 [Verrucomicrobiales bacterium]
MGQTGSFLQRRDLWQAEGTKDVTRITEFGWLVNREPLFGWINFEEARTSTGLAFSGKTVKPPTVAVEQAQNHLKPKVRKKNSGKLPKGAGYFGSVRPLSLMPQNKQ